MCKTSIATVGRVGRLQCVVGPGQCVPLVLVRHVLLVARGGVFEFVMSGGAHACVLVTVACRVADGMSRVLPVCRSQGSRQGSEAVMSRLTWTLFGFKFLVWRSFFVGMPPGSVLLSADTEEQMPARGWDSGSRRTR